jgi:hypothetical protein
MKKKNITIALILVAMAFLPGCYYDNEVALYPELQCDANTVGTFATDVLPLLNSRCNNCHGGSFPSGNIDLTTYNKVMPYVTDGSLLGSVKHASGFVAMPKNSGKLSACDIQKIETWIDAGAANN